MQRIFGRAKPKAEAAPPPDIAAAAKTLNDRVPTLHGKVAECDKELVAIRTQLSRLRPAQQGPLKQKALQILKRKKMYEQQLNATQAKAFNLEQSQFALENIRDAREHVNILKQTTQMMRTEQATVDIDELGEIQEDMADMLADTEEINEMMTRSYDTYDGVNEADLDGELAALGDDVGLGDATAEGSSSSVSLGDSAAGARDELPDWASGMTTLPASSGGGGGGGSSSGVAAATMYPSLLPPPSNAVNPSAQQQASARTPAVATRT